MQAIHRELSCLTSNRGNGTTPAGVVSRKPDGRAPVESESDDEAGNTDDMADFKAKIEIMVVGGEGRKMGARVGCCFFNRWSHWMLMNVDPAGVQETEEDPWWQRREYCHLQLCMVPLLLHYFLKTFSHILLLDSSNG